MARGSDASFPHTWHFRSYKSRGITRPLTALYGSLGKDVVITCKDGTEYTGKISAVDEMMNSVA